MYGGNVVSYKAIIDKVLRDFAFEEKVNNEECLEWLAEFLAHTNSGVVMESKVEYIDITDGRGDLPFDLHKIKQCAKVSGVINAEDAQCGKGSIIPMRWSTDNFHKRYHSDSRDYTTESADTYTVGQGFVFPSFHCGVMAISYDAIPTDCDGYPTIPAEQQWLEAAAFYLAHKIARKMWLRNEITSEKYQLIDRDRDWYFAQAVNHSKQWNGVDEAESFKNQMVRTIPTIQDHASFFANMQLPEQRNFREKSGPLGGGGFVNNLPQGIPTSTSTTPVDYLPIITTGSATSITNTTAICINNLVSYGSTSITNHGICFSTTADPTIDNTVVNLGTIAAPQQFTTNLISLTANTTYYARAFATHGTGTSYGNQITFTTLP